MIYSLKLLKILFLKLFFISSSLQIYHSIILSFFIIFFKNELWAQIIYGPGPFTRGGTKGPSREGLWPKLDKIALGYRRGQFNPRQTQSPTGKRGKNGIGLKLGRKI